MPGPVALARLRANLRQRIGRIDRLQRIQARQMRPRTLAQVELLEKKLAEALTDLRAQKARMQEERERYAKRQAERERNKRRKPPGEPEGEGE